MRKIVTAGLLLAAGAGFAASALAQDRGTGIGVIVGEPTGVSVKHWLDRDTAVDGAVAWSFEGRNSFHLHVDWLRHDFSLLPVDSGALPVYVGVGARYKERRGTDRFGIRIPVGLAYHFADAPLEIFGEIVPILDLAPDTGVNLNAALGIRFYFQ